MPVSANRDLVLVLVVWIEIWDRKLWTTAYMLWCPTVRTNPNSTATASMQLTWWSCTPNPSIFRVSTVVSSKCIGRTVNEPPLVTSADHIVKPNLPSSSTKWGTAQSYSTWKTSMVTMYCSIDAYMHVTIVIVIINWSSYQLKQILAVYRQPQHH